MKALVKKHPKKSVAFATIVSTAILILNFWSIIYKVVCPFVPVTYQPACYLSGKVAAPPVVDSPIDSDGGSP